MTEIVSSFQNLNKDYLQKYESFLKLIHKKKNEYILNKEQKLNYEKKIKYKTILKFSFDQIEKYFKDFKDKFVKNIKFGLKDIQNSFSEFNQYILGDLYNQQQLFKDELDNVEVIYNKTKKKKESYFDYIHNVKLEQLNHIKNFKQKGNKGKVKSL